jgi:O-antigen/teichoic acid export membrane protein
MTPAPSLPDVRPPDAGAMPVARAVPIVAGLVTLPVVHAALGADAFGVWVVLAGALAALSLCDLGLGPVLAREVAAASGRHALGRELLAGHLGLGPLWGVLAGGTGLAATVLCGQWLDGSTRWAAGWLCLALLATGVELPWRAVLEGGGRLHTLAAITAATALLEAGAVIACVRTGGLPALAATTAGVCVVRLLATAAAARRYRPDLAPRPHRVRRAHLRLLREHGPDAQAAHASALVNTELDGLLLGGCYGPVLAGGLAVGARLLDALRLPAGFALLALLPAALDGAARHGTPWLDRFYLRTARTSVAFVAPAAGVVVVCADPLIRLWLGHPLPWAANCLALLAPAHAFGLAAGAATVVTRAEGRTGRETRYARVSAGLTLAFIGPALWLCGPAGPPIASALAVIAGTAHFLRSFHVDSARPFAPVLRATWRPVLAATVAAGTVWCAAGHLPDAAGRAGAALAFGCRAGLVLVVFIAVLAALARTGKAPAPPVEEKAW